MKVGGGWHAVCRRADAGRQLGTTLRFLAGTDVAVLGLPRGGVPVAFEVARALSAPLDVIIVRKLGVPSQPELAMGAVAEGGVQIINEATARLTNEDALGAVEKRERAEVALRAKRIRGNRPRLRLTHRTVVIVDDGVATGSTARAACQVARRLGARRVILAVPVGPSGTQQRMRPEADDVVCLHTPTNFRSIGQFYDDFRQIGDQEVIELLRKADGTETATAPAEGGENPPPHQH